MLLMWYKKASWLLVKLDPCFYFVSTSTEADGKSLLLSLSNSSIPSFLEELKRFIPSRLHLVSSSPQPYYPICLL